MIYEIHFKVSKFILLDLTKLKNSFAFDTKKYSHEEYTEQAKRYFEILGLAPAVTLSTPSNATNTLFGNAWAKFMDLLKRIQVDVGVMPVYLFSRSPVDAPNSLWAKWLQIDLGKGKSKPINVPTTSALPKPTAHPNLYNYFTIRFPDEYPIEAIENYLDKFGEFLPLNGIPAEECLLEYAYLKSDPTPLTGSEYDSIQQASKRLNQNYFKAMAIPVNLENQGAAIRLTVIEEKSWFIGHEQFRNRVNVLVQPEFSSQSALPYTLGNPGQYTEIADHGTKTLGVLMAAKEKQDRCRGIVPNATIQVVSCLHSIELDSQNIVRSEYNEADAVLRAIISSDGGDVILIELGVSEQKYPLEVIPAVFELLRFANQCHIIVIEAAGNKSLIIDSASSSLKNQLDTAQIRNISLRPYGKKWPYWGSYETMKQKLSSLFEERKFMYREYASVDEFANNYFVSQTGAILVGAVKDASTPEILINSSKGDRVRVFAQGENILTTTYGDQNRPSKYGDFGFTSGAAAIIAGYVTSLQGLVKPTMGYIRPELMADLLLTGIALTHGGYIPNYNESRLKLQNLLRVHVNRNAQV